MTTRLNHTIGLLDLAVIARDLRSESGENVEYDRALVELVGTAMGLPLQDGGYEIVANLLDIRRYTHE